MLPVWPEQNYVGEKDTDQVLMLEVYPGEGSWDHFQDDGESFAYRDGVYNQYHCELKDGKLTGKVVSPVTLTGYVPDLLKSISMVSDKEELFGSGMCGKGHKEWVKVSDGGPYLKCKVRLG